MKTPLLTHPLIASYSEMSENERKFVLDTIATHKPRKILELGIAAGANSVLILDFLREQNLLESTQLHSCDYNATYYHHNTSNGYYQVKVAHGGGQIKASADF